MWKSDGIKTHAHTNAEVAAINSEIKTASTPPVWVRMNRLLGYVFIPSCDNYLGIKGETLRLLPL